MSVTSSQLSGVAGLFRVSAAAFLAVLLMLGGGVVAASASTDAPLLSITVQNSVAQVQSGDAVTYTAVLENRGASTVDATVVVRVPSYVTVDEESSAGATVEGGEVSWEATVEAGDSAEFTLDVVIGEIPETERRVTTLVSVFVGDPAELVVRTADAANIVGVEDLPGEVAQEVAQEAATADDRLWLTVGLIAAAVLFVVLLVATVVVVTRSRRAEGAVH